MTQLKRITRDPSVMGGKPCIRGMRATVAMVVGLLAVGRTRDEILREYADLEAEDIGEPLFSATAGARSRSSPGPPCVMTWRHPSMCLPR